MSDTATPKLKKFARQLLAHEAASGNPVDAKDSEAFRACEKLRGPLGKLIGIGGFRSLLSRALALGGKEVPWLRALQIKADGSLEGLGAKLDSGEAAGGEIVLMAQLVGLLVTFIGSELTLQLLHDIWPKIDDHNFRREETL